MKNPNLEIAIIAPASPNSYDFAFPREAVMNQDEKKRQVAEAALEEVRHLLDPKTDQSASVPARTAGCFIDVACRKLRLKSSVRLLSSKATAERLTNYGIEIGLISTQLAHFLFTLMAPTRRILSSTWSKAVAPR